MGEIVGGAFLSATLQVLFDRLASREVLNFLRGRRTVEAKLKELRRKLLVLDTVLDDAEAKYIRKEAVKKWLDELKDAVYDAEDLVDEITYQALRCKVEHEYQSRPNQVTGLIPTSTISFDVGMESKLEEMVHRLEDFVKEKDALGLRVDDGGKSHVSRLPTTSLVDETYVFGRDSEKEDIINLLLSDDACGNEIGVVPIVGMGGIGKTNLSQIVYNDARVNQHFEIKAWVFVSDVFDILGISKLILEGFTRTPLETANLDEIQVSLKEKLCGKKYLIVMDDVWNDNYEMWEILRRPLIAGAYGSKIIATTRNQSVASIMQTLPVQNLQPLSDEDCFSLFSKIAFTHGLTTVPPNLKMMGVEMVKRCKGMPLAAKTLGGLLRSKLDIEEWNDVLKSDLWDLPEDKNNILPALRLSYYYLPSQLKQCFAYCSVFPKGYKFQKERLVLIWMAQSFVQSRGNKTIEKISEEYFDELVSRSLFQQSAHKVTSKHTYFTMHDLVHDLAQAISGQFSIHIDYKKRRDIPKIVRHISLDPFVVEMMGISRFKALNEVKNLRTFLPLWPENVRLHNESLNLLPPLNYLRVLSSPILPHSIDSLTNLRFLDLSGSKILRLPESVCNLYNLRTLLLKECHSLTTLPSEIGKLICLRHLDISTKTYTKISSTKLREMPMQISQLTGLQQLSNYVLGKNGGLDFIGLKELHHLQGSLCISNLQNVTSPKDALVTKLKERELLKELQFEWHGETNDSSFERELLENLQPHTNLTSLSIWGYGGTTFPGWLGDPSFTNLVTLSLYRCQHCFWLPALGQLPSLQELAIESMRGLRKVGSEFCGDVSLGKPFQYLKKLTFRAMREWEEWFMSGTVEFSQLQELCVSDCPKLTGTLPTRIPFLQKFVIFNCPNLMPFPPLQFFLNLKVLMVDWAKLESLSISDEHELQNLKFISLHGSRNMLSVAQGELPAPNVRFLSVGFCTQLKSLPERMCSLLPSLLSLIIHDCPELESFPEGGLPSNLRRLEMGNCKKLVARRREWGIQTLSSLQHFGISNEEELESFPDEGLLPPTLTWLEIRSLPNLKLLNNRGLQLLGSLEVLTIANCPQLQSLPKEGLPNSISKLRIRNCPLLESY
ncbi:putative disease resistance RPP13-like protein 1 [Diospyros lotus]|uniref:putative disease resistance RPP13-like protein 1 n=1 Tax=Diospyros lotus TaxID=55363 RepID=UPI0022554292|nr:putative disease resistance RPP13-like protein 1 [Diospyros lotus]